MNEVRVDCLICHNEMKIIFSQTSKTAKLKDYECDKCKHRISITIK